MNILSNKQEYLAAVQEDEAIELSRRQEIFLLTAQKKDIERGYCDTIQIWPTDWVFLFPCCARVFLRFGTSIEIRTAIQTSTNWTCQLWKRDSGYLCNFEIREIGPNLAQTEFDYDFDTDTETLYQEARADYQMRERIETKKLLSSFQKDFTNKNTLAEIRFIWRLIRRFTLDLSSEMDHEIQVNNQLAKEPEAALRTNPTEEWQPWMHIPEGKEGNTDKKIIELWCRGNNAKGIAKEVAMGDKTVYNVISKLRRAYPEAKIPKDRDRKK